MNCQKGDIARIVPEVREDEWARGIIVCCKDLSVLPQECWTPGEAAWIVEPALCDPSGHLVNGVADSSLRPIRGGDISDEEVRELFAPSMPEQWERAYEEAYGGSRG